MARWMIIGALADMMACARVTSPLRLMASADLSRLSRLAPECARKRRPLSMATHSLRTGVGDAGCLIPPFEYHVLANALSDRASVTLHVYGGEMDRCNLYLPQDDGWWERTPRILQYDNG